MKTTKNEDQELLQPSDLETPEQKSTKSEDNEDFTDKELKDLFGDPLPVKTKKPKAKRPNIIKAYFRYMLEVILK